MGEGEWMARLRAYASSGVWPSGGNRPAPKQRKWHDLYQKDEPGGVQLASAGAACSFWLPAEMRKNIPIQDQRWISNAIFHSGKLRQDLKLWYEPPVPALIYHQTPTPDRFFTHRLMVWMPYHLWKVRVNCPECGKQLTGYGVHKRARKVLDIDRYYLMVTETLRCTVCSLNYLSTSQTVRNQLDLPHQNMFRLILTRKYACDIRVIRDRTLGNSPARLVKQLKENHGEEWLNRLAHYFGECADFVDRPSLFPVVCQEPPEPIDVPTSRWLLSVYGRDILSRLDHIKASITSTFGSILKMDSTKQITKKLAGHAKGTGLWVTSIGNEVGQIVTSVVTVQEGPGLDRMVAGVMERYRQAAIAPPVLLYVDCGCCISEGSSKLQTRFGEWPDLHIRLDIWHFMRRLAVGCTTDAHPLYPTFMGCLSACIFEWDAGDLSLLRRAKKEQLRQEGVPALSDPAVDARITKNELSQYCRRRTRGEEATISLIERLLQELGGANGRDLMGVPLLDQVRIEHIWRVQQRHVKCIQDLPGVHLYTETGTVKKGGVVLTRYRCARGSTSLESFHCHLKRFIPGTSANALNFQLYLLEGLNRWNQDRGTAAVTSRPSSLLTYSGDVTQCVNSSSLKVFAGHLCQTSGHPPNTPAVDESGVPGMDRVDSLAEYLVELRNKPSLVLTNQQVSDIVILWQNLLDFDKQRIVFSARHQTRLVTGRFRTQKNRQEFTPGVESVKRHALTTTAPLAQCPNCCRLVESIFIRLCAIHRSPKKRSRWDLILEDYRRIRQRILANGDVMQQTTMQLVDVSHTTLVKWHNKRVKRQDIAVVKQGLDLPSRLSVAADPLLSANMRPLSAPPQPGPAHQYLLPSSTVGQAQVKRKAVYAFATPVSVRPRTQRQLFPAAPPQLPPPTSAPQLVMLAPMSTQVPVLMAAPQARGFSLMSAPPAPPAPVRKLTRKVLHNTCKKCGQFRTAETGHSQYKGTVYCPSVETVPKEQWLENIKKK
ncbi:hypothetical protein PFLUV_G00228130 [Perca fluviatilis]|uniref:DUF6729 domain-containing protein n=1 Tax=Perca fluviatilis TaxID=8168 RepID=A0A6A5DQ45_PERFL|nr:hypothetical protein PFLUV_G00228130 [Perca fluviatilis]